MKKQILAFVLLALMGILILAGCEEDDPQPTQNIVEIAQNQPNLTSLVTALTKFPDLVATLSGDGDFTVFAPTDAAFSALYTALGVAGINNIDLTTLIAVLQHHIIASPTTVTGRIFSSDLVNGSVATLNGNITISATALTVTSGNGTVANISSNAVLVNVLGTNGVVHTINKVLLPSGK